MDESGGSLSYLWQVPAKPVKVSIRLNVVDRLCAAVMGGFKSLPRRGLETGGLLLGAERRTGRGCIVEIHDFEPLECEHAFGPSYLLSAADRQVLEERLAWHKSSGETTVVGFYRSHTRREFSLTVEDIDLMTACFPRESNVFLLLQSNGEAPPTAGFAIWEGKKIRSSVPYASFEFSRAALAASRAVCAAPPPGWPAEPEPSHEAPEPRKTSAWRPSPAGWWSNLAGRVDWAWIAAAVIVIATLITAALLRRDTAPQIASVPLGLEVRHDGPGLRLRWNHDAAVFQGATGAVLWIGDGERQSKLDLDPAQLAGGSIMYWPSTGDVNFRMEVISPVARGAESIRAVGGPAAAEPAWPPLPEMAQKESPFATPVAPRSHGGADRLASRIRESRPRESRASEERLTNRVAAENLVSERAAATPTRRETPPPVSRASVETGPPPPPAYSLPAPSTRAESTIPLSTRVTEPTPAPAAAPATIPATTLVATDLPVKVEAETVPERPRSSGLLGRLHLVNRPEENPGFVPPRPVTRPALAVPANLRARARTESPIDVRVYVDPTGKVEYAELDSEASQADRDLAALAVFSSRRWQFVPARMGNRKVAGEVVLRYRFGSAN